MHGIDVEVRIVSGGFSAQKRPHLDEMRPFCKNKFDYGALEGIDVEDLAIGIGLTFLF